MDDMLFIGLVAVLLQGAQCLEIEASSYVAQEGDDVSIKCTLNNYTEDDFVLWEKKFRNETLVLGNNTLLNTNLNFPDLGKYSIRSSTRDVGGSVAVDYILDIRDVKLEDSGEIGCSSSTSRVSLNFTVSVPIESDDLYFSTMNSTNENEFIEFIDGDTVDIAQLNGWVFLCETFENYPSPEMEIRLNGVPLATVKTEECYAFSTGFEGPVCDTTIETLSPLSEEQLLRMRDIDCIARAPLQQQPASISVKSSNEAPFIHCEENVVSLPSYSDEFTLTCHVNGTPPFEVIEWSWLMKEGGPRVALRPGQQKGHYGVTSEQNKDGGIRTQLSITRGFPQTFRNYSVFASNHFASDEASVLVEVDPDHPFTSSAFANIPQMIAVFMSMFISSTWRP
ncbi:hypothetical protein CAPTEDRAFT_227068 [Capitella teleta]|uniref:Ig-like domain-containing protein n=1 Tax=Capitella teleta TaxID=283909 RepID=R7TID5_CAPTE|nr:hypothetical protein CAPTEDRAFT_227068 [Capitella teleta]|eukprot:ELT93608.1 hypothetical protein CAPTEDRAFT_227068 [Capitella teleta]